MFAYISLLSLLSFGVFVLLSTISPPPDHLLSNLSKKKSEKIRMETADTAFERMRGLMFREKIIPILFVFDSDGIYPIHSNFVKAPFDAVYLSSDGEALEIFRRIPPNTSLVMPKKKARYLLELPMELTDRLKIEEGDRMEWKKIR